MSLSRGEIAGFLRGYVYSGVTIDEAKSRFKVWLTAQNEAVATDAEKKAILDDLDSYQG